MDKYFVPYEQALALKELGFDEPCTRYYWIDGLYSQHYNIPFNYNGKENSISVPVYQQAFGWFRQEHGLYSHVRESYAFDNTLEFVSQINGSYVNHGIADKPINRFETHEEAELECLKKLIEIVKEN